MRRLDDAELEENYSEEESPPHRSNTTEGGDFAKVCLLELLSNRVQNFLLISLSLQGTVNLLSCGILSK